MASGQQLHRAFSVLGELYAAEHEEHDDKGAKQVRGLLALLRKFAAHEQAEHPGDDGNQPAGRWPTPRY